jgi:hypothetical protein
MKQALHIFLKDARRCWPFSAVVLAITAALAYIEPRWVPMQFPGTYNPDQAVPVLDLLLGMAWWFTIAHLVHGEGLVGDRQFWVTRPYSWSSLFLSKVLFCATFLSTPLLVHDVLVLSAEGFAPAQMVSGLLWRHCCVAEIMMLPPFVLAALTKNMRQFVLAALGVIVALFTFSSIDYEELLRSLLDAGQPRAMALVKERSFEILCVPGEVVLLLLWLYARRRAEPARAVAIGALVSCFAWSAWTSRAIPPSVWEKPMAADTRYPQITVAFDPVRGRVDGPPGGAPDKVEMQIPIELRGGNRELLAMQLAALDLQSEHGEHLAAVRDYPPQAIRSRDADWIQLFLDQKLFDLFNQGHVILRAMFGITVYAETTRIQWPASGDWRTVAGLGKVRIIEDPLSTPALWSRSPLTSPAQRILCSLHIPPDPGSFSTSFRAEWAPRYPLVSDYLHISPVVVFAALFEEYYPHFPRTPLPADATAELILERPVALVRRDLMIENIRLQDYVVGRFK